MDHNIKRAIGIMKSQEEMHNRMQQMVWDSPTGDAKFRVECLVQFHPDKTDRQIFNHARVSVDM
jgi:hypothetical protein